MIVAYVPDLMDRSKVAAAAPDAVFVARAEDLATRAAEVGAKRAVVDLSRTGALDAVAALAAAGVDTVGFGRHDDRELLAQARQAGCARVLARSAFFSRLPEELSS